MRYAVITYANDEVIPEKLEGYSGHLHININDDWFPSDERMNDIFRMILDFCHSKSAWLKIPEDISFYFEDEDLLMEIKDGLYFIFHGKDSTLEYGQFLDWWEEKSISGNDESVPWNRKQVME
jgi:hypothetical protein